MKKQLEIELSKIIDDFKEPKIKFEQYMTPPEIAAFMIHYAWMKGEIENKKIIDIGAGTGMLGIGAAFLGGNVTMIEIDKDAYENVKKFYDDSFEETVRVENIYNRLFMFSGTNYHGVPNFGTKPRLTIAFFGRGIIDTTPTPLNRTDSGV